MNKVDQVIVVNGKQVNFRNSQSGGMIIKCNFYTANTYNSYIGSISNFDNDFVDDCDMMKAIENAIKTKYPQTSEVIVYRYHD